jgi:hypothetical protein
MHNAKMTGRATEVTEATLPVVGLGLLSWKSHVTLRTTLTALRNAGILSCFKDSVIVFQDCSPQDLELAKEFGIRPVALSENTGIQYGMKHVAEALQTEYVLHVENDCLLTQSGGEVIRQLQIALDHLKAGKADVYRFICGTEHRQNGDGPRKYIRFHGRASDVSLSVESLLRIGRRALRPRKSRRVCGNAVYVEDHPEELFPQYIHRQGPDHFVVDSEVINWINRSILYPRSRFLDFIIPYAESHPSHRTTNGMPNLEREMNCEWWKEQHFKIGILPGFFAHYRLDRPPGDEMTALAG